MRFITNFSWEFVQNLPLVAGLMFALQLWQETGIAPAIAAIISGTVLGVAVIRLTEEKIVGQNRAGLQGSREPITVTLTNFVLMAVIMMALTLYLTAAWSNTLTDLFAGGIIGVILSVGQSGAAGRSIGWRHTLAFVIAFPVALITIRVFSAVLPLILAIILITTIVTFVITYLDYGQLSATEEGAN